MPKSTQDLKPVLEDLVARELTRLARLCDVFAAAVYDPAAPLARPKRFKCWHRGNAADMTAIPIAFDFEGIGVWYAVKRRGARFEMHHILLEIEYGRCLHSQAEVSSGRWDDWTDIVAADPWVAERRDRFRPRLVEHGRVAAA